MLMIKIEVSFNVMLINFITYVSDFGFLLNSLSVFE
jgi:hypothetical protein